MNNFRWGGVTGRIGVSVRVRVRSRVRVRVRVRVSELTACIDRSRSTLFPLGQGHG